MQLVEKVKSHSSKWMKTKDKSLQNFYWQNGYSTFSVNPRGVDRVAAYISNQHDHQNKKTFKKEYTTILKKHKVIFDERYVWD